MAEKLSEIAAEKAARLFHELYEAYAPNFDYETREESAVPWSRVPENAYSEAKAIILAAITESREPQWISVDQIKHMVNRFLGWRLPENFNPDGGISFRRMRNEKSPWPANNEPTGTNLLDATQAEEMVRYMVDGLGAPPKGDSNAAK